ncbi:NAD-dependent epimerase/dehydratase family protein [Yinghuangia soli]|uniref:NAD-dependent epimerase/dehydratase family protein n=1 Tax=Yinghuangia soli TaxID=2908204 RepID=A0AA41U4L4_9ACTN|nr:NAD-dependent epimerase/dehydratase family protein [Yinghuangia soli]MCF2533848.1 NAD-dependent epimerase/dehydratase family protein [Yinghuangia soli]
MGERILVVGGTGPTGTPLVRGLVARGHEVAILHRGLHESPDTPGEVRHVHLDPYDDDALREAAAGPAYDMVIAMYGRLRRIAEAFAGRTGRFLSVGGVPAYRGWMNPALAGPGGLPVPVPEDAPLVRDVAEDAKGYRIVRTEEAVFAHHPQATHVRYPYVYGPKQPAPREWCIVRRVLDGRRRIVLADDGLTLHHHGYTENLAHALLLAVDHPERSAGRIYNAADDEVLTIRQVVEAAAAALGHTFEIVSMPFDLAVPARPLVMQPAPVHRVLDLARIRADLGYRDLVAPREAVARTARWLAENPPSPGGREETILTDPFDYAAEDRLMDAWSDLRDAFPDAGFGTAPGYGLAYSGPGGRPRSRPEFEA